MPDNEKEFVTRRLQIVEEKLGHPSKYDIDERGGFHQRIEVSPSIEYALIREARILEKINNEVVEGKVRQALLSWRKLLGEKFKNHREYYRHMQDVHDAWLEYPWTTRIDIPEPPQPPNCEITDQTNHTWVVDDQLLKVFDDLVLLLDKWISTND